MGEAMSEADIDSLFRELKPDVESLANPLFDASRDFVSGQGARSYRTVPS